MNVTAIAMAEAQMVACYRNIQNGVLSVLPEASGTSDGISKMLYLRESRRSMGGVGGFRLCHSIMDAKTPGPGGEGCSTAADPPGRAGDGAGYQFLDTVALGAPQPTCGFDVHDRNGAFYHATSATRCAIRTRRFRSSSLFELSPSPTRLTCWSRANPWRHRSSPTPSPDCTPTSGPPAQQQGWRPS